MASTKNNKIAELNLQDLTAMYILTEKICRDYDVQVRNNYSLQGELGRLNEEYKIWSRRRNILLDEAKRRIDF